MSDLLFRANIALAAICTILLIIVVSFGGPIPALAVPSVVLGASAYQAVVLRPKGQFAIERARKKELSLAQKEVDEFNAYTKELERDYCSVWATRLLEAKMVEAGSLKSEEMSVCDNVYCADCNKTKKIIADNARALAYVREFNAKDGNYDEYKKPTQNYLDVLHENAEANYKAIEQYKRVMEKYDRRINDTCYILTRGSNKEIVRVTSHKWETLATGSGYIRKKCKMCNKDYAGADF